MPGLLRGGTRGAARPGTATAVSHRVRRRQNKGWAEQGDSYYPTNRMAPPPEAAPPQPMVAPAAESAKSTVDRLKALAELKERGVLTDEEFAAQKERTLTS